MAAEGASSGDSAEISSSWRRELQTDGVLITNAKGLHDHADKTRGVATEKQAALDILLIEQLVQDQVLGPLWTPLTKEMPGVLLESFRSKLFSKMFSKRHAVPTYQRPDAKGERLE